MLTEDAEDTDKAIRKIFRGQTYRPYRMPIYKVIPGPSDMHYLDEFMKLYRSDENWETAIESYKNQELQSILLFRDEASGLLLYTTFNEFISINRIHINWGLDE